MSARALAPALLVLASCATPTEEQAFAGVEALSAERLQGDLHWRRGGPEDAAADARVDELLALPLSADAAVQVALLENRGLQAEYERLGVSLADLVQAGLLRNPVFVGTARFPGGSGSGTNVELSVVQDFLDLLLRPARLRLARTQLEETQLAVAAEVLELAARVRAAYFTALGAKQAAAVRRLVVDAAEASAELARRLSEAGNLSDRALATELSLYETTRVAWARSLAEEAETREALTRLLGVWGPRTGWSLPEGLPEIPGEEPSLEDVEARAVERRLDLAAARASSEALAQALGVARDWRWLAVAELGVSSERDVDGTWVTGPEVALELPVFDRRQAELARLAAELRRADQEVIALAVQVRSEVRAARDRLLALRGLAAHYREAVVPLREAAVALAQEEHDYMQVGAFDVIAAKEAEYEAYHEYVETVRDYWIARSELERAMGGGALAFGAAAGAGPAAPAPAAPPEHHHPGHGGR